ENEEYLRWYFTVSGKMENLSGKGFGKLPELSAGWKTAYSSGARLGKDNAGNRADPPAGGATSDSVSKHYHPAAVAGTQHRRISDGKLPGGGAFVQRPETDEMYHGGHLSGPVQRHEALSGRTDGRRRGSGGERSAGERFRGNRRQGNRRSGFPGF